MMNVTKKSWAQAHADLTGSDTVEKFATVADACQAFVEAADEAGLSWDVVEGQIAFGDASSDEQPQEPADQPQEPADQSQEPADQSQEPADQSQEPADQSQEPADQDVDKPRADRRTPEDSRSVITLLATSNPKRPGSATHARFALYRTGMTVAEFLAAGGKRVDLPWDTAHGFIAVGPAPAPVAAEAETTEQA